MCQSTVCLCCDRTRLLMVAEHERELRIPAKGIVEMHRAPAGYNKHVMNPMFNEQVSNEVRDAFHARIIAQKREVLKSSIFKELAKRRFRIIRTVYVIYGERSIYLKWLCYRFTIEYFPT